MCSSEGGRWTVICFGFFSASAGACDHGGFWRWFWGCGWRGGPELLCWVSGAGLGGGIERLVGEELAPERTIDVVARLISNAICDKVGSLGTSLGG